MRNPIRFFTDLLKRPFYEVIWVFYMMAINLAAVYFWEELLAKIIVILFLVSSMLMMGLYSKFGFTKILGLGHTLWLPLVFYIGYCLMFAEGFYFTYLFVLLITILISLVIDGYDVWTYFKEESEVPERL
jgi:hypothetical protein